MKHCIIIKFKENYDFHAAAADIRKMFEKALLLDGVEQILVRTSCSDRENRHDMMIEMTLTPDGLRLFDSSDIHAAWKSIYGDAIKNKVIFDCES